jgi:hypothetical protein
MRWDVGREIAPAAYDWLRVDPRYARAVRTFAANMLAAGDEDRLLDGILKDAGRNVAALCAAHLHYSGGLTLPRLKALCASFGLVSPGRARALLLYLRYLGYVEPKAERERGAAAVYVPTPQFVHTWRNHQRAVLKAALVLEPAVGILLAHFDEPAVFETFAKLLCEGFLGSAGETDLNSPYFRVFMHRHAGIQIVHALLAASADDVFPPERPIALSLSAAARRFRVSRIHLRRLLDAAEREGLLRLTADGAVQFEPAGREAIDAVFATQMIRFLEAAARTLALCPDLAQASADARAPRVERFARDEGLPAHLG